jgi:hypothetical protein
MKPYITSSVWLCRVCGSLNTTQASSQSCCENFPVDVFICPICEKAYKSKVNATICCFSKKGRTTYDVPLSPALRAIDEAIFGEGNPGNPLSRD